MDKTIIKIKWAKRWKTTVIMTWVHGNERSWINVFTELINKIEIENWILFLILWNPNAIKKNIRFIEKDLNRCFRKKITWKTYEDKRAIKIREILKKADYLLDIHNTINPSDAFLISEWKEIAKIFPVKKIVSGFDLLHPWGSDSYMNNIWKIWLCIECWNIGSKIWEKIAKTSIINFLKYTWNIVWKPIIFKNQNFMKFDYIYKSKTNTFILNKKFKDFEKIKKWQIVWYDWEEIVRSYKNWYIIFSKSCNEKWSEAFALWNTIK